jgi:hypothetical protein
MSVGNKSLFGLNIKQSCMKRKALYTLGFVLMALSVTSCEGLFETCKVCSLVSTVAGVETRGTPIELCGTELAAKEAMGTITIVNGTAYWECN